MAALSDYDWVFGVAVALAFGAAYGIGANDVANAFATSVGAKSIQVWQAVVFAAIFEFSGALLLGGRVTETIRNDIADPECFSTNPALLMYGMTCVLFSVMFWLILASRFEMPVSTTHSAVGGVIGMTMALVGSGCVTWNQSKDTFPFVGGVFGILVSWLISPVFSGLFSALLYQIVRYSILTHQDSYRRAYIFYPILIGITVGINVLFILLKGIKRFSSDIDKVLSDPQKAAVALGFGAFVGLCMIPITYRYIKPNVDARIASWGDVEKAKADKVISEFSESSAREPEQTGAGHKFRKLADRMQDKMASAESDETVMSIHSNSETWDRGTEEVFKYLQVFTAICDSFAHGANDVANAMGPFAAVYFIWQSGVVGSDTELGNDAYWILALGGSGIVVGLATYGYRIMSAIGVKLTKITPARGFAIELGAAVVVILGSAYGWPLSTTHCQVGATMGVALSEGANTVNWKKFGTIVCGWIFTLVVAGGVAAIVAAQGAYSPHV